MVDRYSTLRGNHGSKVQVISVGVKVGGAIIEKAYTQEVVAGMEWRVDRTGVPECVEPCPLGGRRRCTGHEARAFLPGCCQDRRKPAHIHDSIAARRYRMCFYHTPERCPVRCHQPNRPVIGMQGRDRLAERRSLHLLLYYYTRPPAETHGAFCHGLGTACPFRGCLPRLPAVDHGSDHSTEGSKEGQIIR